MKKCVLILLALLLGVPSLGLGQTTNARTFSGTGTSITATGSSLNTNVTNTVTVSGSVTVSGTVAATQSGTWTVQPGNTANTTAWKVDGSAVTQPVSGTVTATGPLTDTQLRATAVPVSGTVTVTDGSGALNVIVDSGVITSITNTVTVSGNLTNISGTISLPTGASTLAEQQTQTTALQTLDNIVSGSGVNITQIGGTNLTLDPFGSQRETLRNGYGIELGTAINPVYVTLAPGMTTQLSGFPLAVQTSRVVAGPFNTPIGISGDRLKTDPTPSADRCTGQRKTDVAISQTATTRIILGLPGQVINVCLVRIVVGAAEITSELEGTGTNCGTGTIAHSGSTTAANGESFAANGGYMSGDGNSTVISLSPGTDFCIGQNGVNRVSGKVSYVYGPG